MKIKYLVLTVIIVAASFIGHSYYQSNKNNVQIINMDCAAIPELVHYNDVILSSIK